MRNWADTDCFLIRNGEDQLAIEDIGLDLKFYVFLYVLNLNDFRLNILVLLEAWKSEQLPQEVQDVTRLMQLSYLWIH
jgi:hypothetical protein